MQPDSDEPPLASNKGIPFSPPLLDSNKGRQFPPPTTPLSTDTPTANCRKIGIVVDLRDEPFYVVKWSVEQYLRPGDEVILFRVCPGGFLDEDCRYMDLSIAESGNDDEEFRKLVVHSFDVSTDLKFSDLTQKLEDAQFPHKVHMVKDYCFLAEELKKLGLTSLIIMRAMGFYSAKDAILINFHPDHFHGSGVLEGVIVLSPDGDQGLIVNDDFQDEQKERYHDDEELDEELEGEGKKKMRYHNDEELDEELEGEGKKKVRCYDGAEGVVDAVLVEDGDFQEAILQPKPKRKMRYHDEEELQEELQRECKKKVFACVRAPRRRALVVGCQYFKHPANYEPDMGKLRGIDNDLKMMLKYLSFVKKFDDITLLFDGSEVTFSYPRPRIIGVSDWDNIMEELRNLIDGAIPGDEYFFYFSGHGTLFIKEGEDERIVYRGIVTADNRIVTAEDFRLLLSSLPIGSTITMLFDCCFGGGFLSEMEEQDVITVQNFKHTGSSKRDLVDVKRLPIEKVMRHFANRKEWNFEAIRDEMFRLFGDEISIVFKSNYEMPPFLSIDKVIYISACRKTEEAYVSKIRNHYCSLFSYYLVKCARHEPDSTNLVLLLSVAWRLHREVYYGKFTPMHPSIYCSRANAQRIFLGGFYG